MFLHWMALLLHQATLRIACSFLALAISAPSLQPPSVQPRNTLSLHRCAILARIHLLTHQHVAHPCRPMCLLQSLTYCCCSLSLSFSLTLSLCALFLPAYRQPVSLLVAVREFVHCSVTSTTSTQVYTHHNEFSVSAKHLSGCCCSSSPLLC